MSIIIYGLDYRKLDSERLRDSLNGLTRSKIHREIASMIESELDRRDAISWRS